MENGINAHSVCPHSDSVPRASLNDDDPENHPDLVALTTRLPPRPIRPPLTLQLPPRRRPCMLCSHVHAVLHLQHPIQTVSRVKRGNGARAVSVLKRENNSAKTNALTSCSRHAKGVVTRPWIVFGSIVMLLMQSGRDGCIVYGSHNITAAACTSPGDFLLANCLPCLAGEKT